MAETITYGSYTFPSPTPFVGHGVEPIYIGGKVDHTKDTIDLVGNLTGENLSGLHLQKMKMMSGLMSEFQTLTVSNDSANRTYQSAKPESVSFDSSDLTTVLPYTISFSSYSSGAFSEFLGIKNPVDQWSFNEEDGRIVNVDHTVSAEGVETGNSAVAVSPLTNAYNFVTGRATGCLDLSLFNTGGNAFLTSRTEDINKSTNSYSIRETFLYSTTENQVTDSGIFKASTQISFDKDNGLKVNVEASVQGSMDGGKTGHIVHTGLFTSGQATEIALNAVVSSLSDYESGSYTFVGNGPTSASYNIDTGANTVNFSYGFDDPDLDQEGNVLHTKTASVQVSKDNSKVQVSLNGEFKYNSPFEIAPTGDPTTGKRFLEVDAQYSGVVENSGFLNLAVEALQDFTGYVTGYDISGDYLNPNPLSRSITKTPADGKIGYSLSFDNTIDLSSGTLSGLKITIQDTRPIIVSGVVPSIAGFAKQRIKNRSAGEFSISANCESGNLQKVIDVVSGHMTVIYTFSESSSVDDKTTSYNTSRYY